jgi:hypothetical protein
MEFGKNYFLPTPWIPIKKSFSDVGFELVKNTSEKVSFLV